jgi:hypothetical protein
MCMLDCPLISDTISHLFLCGAAWQIVWAPFTAIHPCVYAAADSHCHVEVCFCYYYIRLLVAGCETSSIVHCVRISLLFVLKNMLVLMLASQ